MLAKPNFCSSNSNKCKKVQISEIIELKALVWFSFVDFFKCSYKIFKNLHAVILIQLLLD